MNLRFLLPSRTSRGLYPSTKLPKRKLKLNDLNDDSLLIIFDQLPLRNLFLLRRVCPRWIRLLKVACKRRRSMTLLIGVKACYQSIKTDTPELEEVVNNDGIRAAGWWSNYALVSNEKRFEFRKDLNVGTCNQLIEALPNITTLRIAQAGISIDSLYPVIHLLREFSTNKSSKLKTLVVMLHFTRAKTIDEKAQYNSLFFSLIQAINQLSTLRSLQLDIYHKLDSSSHHPQIALPILGQLEQFSFYSLDDAKLVLEQIRIFGYGNENLKKIELRSSISDRDDSLEDVFQMDRNLATRFSELRITSFWVVNGLAKLCSRFMNLNKLYIVVRELSMMDLMSSLVQLSQLLCLHLIFTDPQPFESDAPALPQMHTVIGLSLHLTLRRHRDLNFLALATTFPNVQVLGIRNNSTQCSTCKYNLRRAGRIRTHLCNSKMLKGLKGCEQLKRVYLDNRVYWTFYRGAVLHYRHTFTI